jgi:hypothetical protein
MSIIKSIIKIFTTIIILGVFSMGFYFIILPNKLFFDNVSKNITESLFGLETKTNWIAEHNQNKNIKAGFYIRPYILGVQGPKIWISSKDSINENLISKWKLYDASF